MEYLLFVFIGNINIDPTIFETFKVNHPKTKLIEGDIRNISENDFPDSSRTKLTQVVQADDGLWHLRQYYFANFR